MTIREYFENNGYDFMTHININNGNWNYRVFALLHDSIYKGNAMLTSKILEIEETEPNFFKATVI